MLDCWAESILSTGPARMCRGLLQTLCHRTFVSLCVSAADWHDKSNLQDQVGVTR